MEPTDQPPGDATTTGRFVRASLPPPVARIVVALLLTAAAAALTYLLRAYLPTGVFLIFYPAAAAAAWYGGFVSSLVVVAIGIGMAQLLFFGPGGTLDISATQKLVFMVVFAALSAAVNLLVTRIRAAQRRAEAQASEARALAAQLAEKSALLDLHARDLESRAVELERAMAEAESARLQAEAAYARSELERRRVNILAETSRALSESRGYEQRLRALAQLVTRELADYCVIDVLEEGGGVQRLATAARDPEKQQLIDETRRWAPQLDQRSPVAEVLRTGEPQVALDVTPEVLLRDPTLPEYAHLLADLAPTSFVIMPLAVAERRLGAITVIRAAPSQPFEPADVELVRVLATRAALLIEMARLYQEAQLELQRRHRAEASLREKSLHLEALNLEQQRMLAQLAERTEQAELAERAALEASQAKSQFLAVMSHELRTPLNAIMGYTDLLQSGATGISVAERERGFLDRIRVSVLHLRGLIDEVLSLSRIEAGKEDVATERVSLAGVLRDVANMVQAQALDKGLRIRLHVESDVVLTTDAGKLRQILLNLASNAVKFTDDGEVTLRLHTHGGSAEVMVSDTGIGIPPEHQDRIFDPFTQVDQSRTRRAGGSGLGLSVSRKLALLLGGELSFESTPGRGSNFVLNLPLTEPQPQTG